MTRDEMIAKAMPSITGAGPGDEALLDMASTMFLEQIAELADAIASRFEDSRYRQFDEAIACGQLHAHADAMPGITLHVRISEAISYQMRSIWSLGTRLPETLQEGVAGRRAGDVIELPCTLPAVIRDASIKGVFNAGNRKDGFNSRFDLDQPQWRAPAAERRATRLP